MPSAHLDMMRFGVATAQRGWLTKDDVINAWPITKLERFLRKGGVLSRRRLPRSFYARAAVEVAPDLLGRTPGPPVCPTGRASPCGSSRPRRTSPGDPASHAFRGMTARNAVMFGAAGPSVRVLHLRQPLDDERRHAAATDEGSAVLLRAAEPLDGLDAMALREGATAPSTCAPGPGSSRRPFAVDRAHDGTDLVRGTDLWIEAGTPRTAR